ncbi:hypothetical protein HRF69_19095, partial [Bacillus circulans]|uniref:hypothetical protein n=1 Tax=Niallia circulans TaxID=1397 RepID=UPI00155FB365
QRESAKLGKYQPKYRENQPNLENISQSTEGISQTWKISAKAQRVSAKLGIYQPKLRGNQPNLENISQNKVSAATQKSTSQRDAFSP